MIGARESVPGSVIARNIDKIDYVEVALVPSSVSGIGLIEAHAYVPSR